MLNRDTDCIYMVEAPKMLKRRPLPSIFAFICSHFIPCDLVCAFFFLIERMIYLKDGSLVCI